MYIYINMYMYIYMCVYIYIIILHHLIIQCPFYSTILLYLSIRCVHHQVPPSFPQLFQQGLVNVPFWGILNITFKYLLEIHPQ